MRTILIHGIALLSLALAAAGCRPDTDDHTVPPRAERNDEPISVSGCLTSGAEQKNFVLTAASAPLTSTAARVAGTTPTFTYELVGGENLDRHLGRQVTVHGRLADEKDDAEFTRRREEPVDEQTPRGQTPTVASKEEVNIEVRRLYVESVDSNGDTCTAG